MAHDGPAPRLEPNARVAGKLRLLERLATGGMGEVWRARNESTGADVALKVLRRGVGATAETQHATERFRNEARLSAMLSHRSIVKVFDLVEDPWGTLLVMELLRGETLQSYVLRKGPRPAREAVAILSPILGALAHAHERGIVHRDVTPANIFLSVDPDGHVTPKLLDFGIAKLASGATPADIPMPEVQTLDGSVLGTPRYMAPERIRGEEGVDGRADVFSAAVVLYEVLTGTCPFAASTPTGSLAAVLEQQVDPDPRIDPRLWVEVRRALSKRPFERHVTAKELATALRAALGETEGALATSLQLTIPPPGANEHAESTRPGFGYGLTGAQGVVVQPRRRRSSTVWVLAGVLVGALVGLVGFGLRALNRAPASSAPPLSESVMVMPAPALPSATETASPPSTTSALSAIPVAPAPAQTTTPSASGAAPRVLPPARLPVVPVAPPARARPVATTPGF